MIVHQWSARAIIIDYTLSARRINVAVATEYQGATVLRQTIRTACVSPWAGRRRGAAHHNLILVARCRQTASIVAACAAGKEQVVPLVGAVEPPELKAAFGDGGIALSRGYGAVEDLLSLPSARLHGEIAVVEHGLVDVVPGGAKGKIDGGAGAFAEEIRVNQIVGAGLWDADAAVIGERAGVAGWGGGNADI